MYGPYGNMLVLSRAFVAPLHGRQFCVRMHAQCHTAYCKSSFPQTVQRAQWHERQLVFMHALRIASARVLARVECAAVATMTASQVVTHNSVLDSKLQRSAGLLGGAGV